MTALKTHLKVAQGPGLHRDPEPTSDTASSPGQMGPEGKEPLIPFAPPDAELERPPTLVARVEAIMRFGAVVAAAVPTTTVPPMALTALVYRRFRDEERYHRWHQMSLWASFCTRHIMKSDVRVLGKERLPNHRRGLLCVSNHQSYVDIPVIMGALPFRAFLSKSLVAYIPVLGPIAWLGGTIYFDRHKPEGRKKAQDDLLRMCADSTPVVLFPEGTRSKDGRLRDKVHLGAVRAAWERGLSVCPFALDGTRHVFPPTMDRMYTNQRVAIVVGEELSPKDFSDGDAFAEATWAEVGRRFAEARALRSAPGWDALPRP